MAFSAQLRDFRKRPQPLAHVMAPPSPAEAVCLVGDLHGRLDCLEALLALRVRHFAQARLVFLGDMIDRGPESAAVLTRVRAESAAGAICLMGNHEEMLLAALSDPTRHAASWLKHGGYETLLSFGLSEKDGISGLAAALGAETRAWLTALPLFWRSGNLAASHAGMDPALPPEQQEDRALLWGHPDFGRKLRPDGLWVARGHVVTARAEQRAGCMSLDAGAYATGRLSYALIDPALPPAEKLPLGAVTC